MGSLLLAVLKLKEHVREMRGAFDSQKGYHIRVNLYIIRFIYCHIDSKSKPNKTGTIKKYRAMGTLHSEEYFPNRQRFDRISKGKNFDFSRVEAARISETFGISKEYFTDKAKEPFYIKEITNLDWACLYKKEYALENESVKNLTEQEIEDRYERVIKALKNTVKNWGRLSLGDPIYAICFYYYYNVLFINKPKQTDTLKGLLEKITYDDWEKENINYLEVTYKLMKKHFNYLRYKVELEQLRKKEKESIKTGS